MIETDFERFVEEASNRFYGKYRGTLVDNDAAAAGLRPGSLQVQVPAVLGDTALWALPCSPYAGDGVGFFALPPVGASLWVEFEGGRADYPIWSGGFWQAGEVDAADAGPDTVFLKTPGASIVVKDAGTIEISTAGGTRITLTGSDVTIEAPLIRLSANGASASLSASGFDAMNGALTVI